MALITPDKSRLLGCRADAPPTSEVPPTSRGVVLSGTASSRRSTRPSSRVYPPRRIDGPAVGAVAPLETAGQPGRRGSGTTGRVGARGRACAMAAASRCSAVAVLLAAAAGLVILDGAGSIGRDRGRRARFASDPSPALGRVARRSPSASAELLVVDVQGAVVHPGVVRLVAARGSGTRSPRPAGTGRGSPPTASGGR